MAVRFDASADRLLRTTDLLDYNAAYTWMAWVVIDVDLNANSNLFALNDNSLNNIDQIRTNATGTTLVLRTAAGGTADTVSGTDLTVGTYYHLALVRESASSIKLYVNGVLDATGTQDISGRTAATRMEHGAARSATTQEYNGRVAHIKAWSVALTAEQVAAELRAVRPLHRLDQLYGWWPTRPGSGERTKDYSGRGRDWTEGGTLTDEDSPPISWGASVLLIPGQASGAAPVTGEAALTLDALTTSAAGAVAVAGAASLSLGALTSSAAGTVVIAGAGAVTLGALTLAATGGAPATVGEAALTLGALTASGAGKVAVAGAASLTLGALTSSGAGAAAVRGSAAVTLGALTLSASGGQALTGQAALTLGALTLASAGKVAVAGSAALTLGVLTLTATGAGPQPTTFSPWTGQTLAPPAIARAGVARDTRAWTVR